MEKIIIRFTFGKIAVLLHDLDRLKDIAERLATFTNSDLRYFYLLLKNPLRRGGLLVFIYQYGEEKIFHVAPPDTSFPANCLT